jgi:hypothetical protein
MTTCKVGLKHRPRFRVVFAGHGLGLRPFASDRLQWFLCLKWGTALRWEGQSDRSDADICLLLPVGFRFVDAKLCFNPFANSATVSSESFGIVLICLDVCSCQRSRARKSDYPQPLSRSPSPDVQSERSWCLAWHLTILMYCHVPELFYRLIACFFKILPGTFEGKFPDSQRTQLLSLTERHLQTPKPEETPCRFPRFCSGSQDHNCQSRSSPLQEFDSTRFNIFKTRREDIFLTRSSGISRLEFNQKHFALQDNHRSCRWEARGVNPCFGTWSPICIGSYWIHIGTFQIISVQQP